MPCFAFHGKILSVNTGLNGVVTANRGHTHKYKIVNKWHLNDHNELLLALKS